MVLSGEYKVESLGAASGDKAISLRGGKTEGKGQARFTFNGPAGDYNVKIAYFDENDGVGTIQLKQGSQTIANFALDQQLGSTSANTQTLTSREIQGVSVQAGDTFTFEGIEDGSRSDAEHVRIDYVQFIPVDNSIPTPTPNPKPQPSPTPQPKPNPTPTPNPTLRVEAEEMNLAGEYRVESNRDASSRKVISLRGGKTEGEGRAAFKFDGPSGNYDVKVAYFDENDGVGQLKLHHGTQELKTITLNQQLGSTSANAQTLTSTEIQDVSIKAGDTFTLTGLESGNNRTAEHARVDYIEFIPATNSSTPTSGSNIIPKPISRPKPITDPNPVNQPKTDGNSQSDAPAVLSGDAGAYDYIVFHFDGNNNDRDDIASLPMAALYAKAAGIEDKTFFFYNNNLGEPNNSFQVKAMRESAAFAEKLGIKTYDYQANINGTTNELAKILNSGKKVLALQGGPMEAIYRGLEKTNPENRNNITLLSHGQNTFNQTRKVATRPGVSNLRVWKDIKNDFPEVNLKQIQNQNGSGNKGFRSNNWKWLDNSKNPLIQEARQLMRNAKGQANDTSDAGMLYYAITGAEDGDPLDAKAFFEKNPPSLGGGSEIPGSPRPKPIPAPDGSGSQDKAIAHIEAEDMVLSGEYRVESINAASGDQAISLRGGKAEGQGEASFTFDGPSGEYDIKITYFDENDGVGTIKLSQDGQSIANFQLDQQLGSTSPIAQTLTSREIQGISVQAGDTFTLQGIEDGSQKTAEHTRIDHVEFISRGNSKNIPFEPNTGSNIKVGAKRGEGLQATYFSDRNLTNPVLERTDAQVNFFWGQDSPAPNVEADTFSTRWSGYVVPEHSETYEFQTFADDGVRLKINDQLLIDDWNQHAPKTQTGSIDLEAGKAYPITLEYFENQGSAVSQLSWSSPSQQLEVIPQSQLFTPSQVDVNSATNTQ